MIEDSKAGYELRLKRLRDEYAISQTSYKRGYQEGYQEGYQKGREEGEEIGIAKANEKNRLEKMEAIKKLLQFGILTISQIAQVFSVNEAFVLDIQNTMNNKEK